jgi:acyl-CoA dehydrogenase
MEQILDLIANYQATETIFILPAIIAFLFLLGYVGVSFIIWVIYLSVAALYFQPSLLFWQIYILITLIFLVPFIRRHLITRFLVMLIKAKKMLPEISETEKIALNAGNVWIEKELFSGKPDFHKIFKETYPKLTKEERSFVNGQVDKVCQMTDDWRVFNDRDLPKATWDYLKKEKFFGMIIPKKYGGLGYSALAHSTVVHKLASRSQVLAITVMVPNSLGPAELLMRYGTEEQKDYYLPRLAIGKEIPCFALTEPTAGTDATSIKADGEVFKDAKGNIKIRINWEKRYITLGAVATVIGLAFRLRDPKNLLGKGKNPGITCALLSNKTKGITVGRRHDPLEVPFINSPIFGKDVEIDVENIIGGADGVGEGWKMLMECLSIGRGISLPATSTGAAKLVSRVIGNYAKVRKQFGLSIGKFEGVEEAMARIAGHTYMLEAARKFTAGAIDNGYKPSVVNAIAKYHFTEKFRDVVNDGMDIAGGAAICRGPRNLLAHAYFGVPVAITVEGANIMTRTLLQFGQGAVRCHPYSYNEMEALMAGDLKKFDYNFFKHIGHLTRNKTRSALLSVTRGYLHIPSQGGVIGKYERKLAWASASFAFFADLALAKYGGEIKRKEKLNGRFGDVLSWLYLGTATLRRYSAEGQKSKDTAYVHWVMQNCFAEMQTAFDGIMANFGSGFIGFWLKYPGRLWSGINPIGTPPSDALGHQVAKKLMIDDKARNRLTSDIFIPTKKGDALADLEDAFKKALKAESVERKIKAAIRSGKITKKTPLSEILAQKIINSTEAKFLKDAETAMLNVVQVDSFEIKDYLSHKMSSHGN